MARNPRENTAAVASNATAAVAFVACRRAAGNDALNDAAPYPYPASKPGPVSLSVTGSLTVVC